jgi:hypothetical protein
VTGLGLIGAEEGAEFRGKVGASVDQRRLEQRGAQRRRWVRKARGFGRRWLRRLDGEKMVTLRPGMRRRICGQDENSEG